MLKNYFRVAWRALLRSKAFSFINIFGLALGLAASLLIVLWVMLTVSFQALKAALTNPVKSLRSE